MAYGWIGGPAAGGPADRAEGSPSLVVSAAHSAFGAVRRLQVRVGEVTVLLHPAPPAPRTGAGVAPPTAPVPHHAPPEAGWVREAVVEELDIAAHLAAHLDLAGREDEDAPERWTGSLPAGRYAALRRADPADAGALAASAGCPVGLVRALTEPVALSRVEVVRRDGAARGTGPVTVGTDELAWVDGGEAGLWTMRPGDPDEVLVGRGTPAEVAAELAGMVRAAEGC